jgi:hypothetical protein
MSFKNKIFMHELAQVIIMCQIINQESYVSSAYMNCLHAQIIHHILLPVGAGAGAGAMDNGDENGISRMLLSS